ncbi:MAG: hypothetical protein COW30_12760 [Rhodospirillales bacterium CG15_BIG_FIL_POST_REV_8_21_14_020_66_15]|nr:MAG: hypothetical protein COW30_12760 [Rhodospirillales bacterium CG15_BIG_FIL_POST_REV_8_21_14_020_66_15]
MTNGPNHGLLPHHQAAPAPMWYQPMPAAPYAMPPEADGWDLLRRIWRRKGLVLAITVLVVALAAAVVVAMPSRYTADTRVLVGVQDPNVLNVQSVLKAISPDDSTIRSEAYIVASRSMAREVAYRLALDTSPQFNPDLAPEPTWLDLLHPGYLLATVKGGVDYVASAIGLTDEGDAPSARGATETEDEHQRYIRQTIESRLLDGLTVEPLNRSHVLNISAEFEDPALSARIANSFARVYVERQLVEKRKANLKANQWLKAQVADLQAKVSESERAVETYRQKHDLLSTRSETLIGQQLAALNQALIAAEKSRTEAQANLEQAKGLADGSLDVENLPGVLQSPLILMLRGKQADLAREAADLAAKYTAKHPKRRHIQAQLRDLDSKIGAEITRIRGGLRHQLQIATEQRDRVASQLESLKARMGTANEEQVKLRQLERQADADRNMLEQLLQRTAETSHQDDLLKPDAEIISHAAVPVSPSFPPDKLIIVVAVLGGLGLGVLIALLVEKLDQTFRTSEEIEEYTGLTTLAVLPQVKRGRSRPLTHVIDNPNSVYANAVRMLTARLSFDRGSKQLPSIVMFTSTVPGEGKSHTSCSLAQSAALDGKKAVLVDLDWRQPTQHLNFDQMNDVGMLDILRDEASLEQALYHDPESGADVLFAGRNRGRETLSVSLERLRLVLQRLATQYDLVVLDTPPLVVTPEMQFLAQIADTVVFNVRWGSTTRQAVTSELKKLLQAGADMAGVVLSQVDLSQYNKYSYDDGGYLRHRHLVREAY